MAGSTNDLLESLNRIHEIKVRIIESPEQKKFDEGMVETLNYLRQSAKERNIGQLLHDERLLLTHSLKFDATSQEETKRLTAAINQLDESLRCLNLLEKSPAVYKENATIYSSKRKEAGLPLDAARKFLKSHETRLNNTLAGKASHSDKLLLRQRKENLKVIRECYIDLQKKSLGLPPEKEKAKG
ncbi:MAG: hypothetical protein ACRCTY_09805 [Candidatus Adiutrix sp.]